MQTEEIVLKSEFARLIGVSAPRVSQFISEGKIGPEALVGEGRGARVRLSVAVQHLKDRLDTSQRFGLNGLGTKLAAPAPAAAPPPAPQLFAPEPSPRRPPTPPADPEPDNSIEAQIKAQKFRQTELATRRMEEEDRLLRGVYVRAEDAAQEYAKIVGEMRSIFEGALVDFAGAIAAKYGMPSRDLVHLLNAEFRPVCQRIAAKYAALAAAAPETTDDDDTYDVQSVRQ
jgi:hypothetical protein